MDMEKHPKIFNTLKRLGIVLLLMFIVFLIAALRSLSKIDNSNKNSSSKTTGSIIDSFIPTTEAPNTEILEEVSSIFNHEMDVNFKEEVINAYKYNRYMKQLSYTYDSSSNTHMYSYENKTIITLDDLSGIIKIFVFNTNTNALVNSIKTVYSISDDYTALFVVIDGEIYYINANTFRSDNCLIINTPLVIDKYDLTTEKEINYKTYDKFEELKINCK